MSRASRRIRTRRSQNERTDRLPMTTLMVTWRRGQDFGERMQAAAEAEGARIRRAMEQGADASTAVRDRSLGVV